jgi:hypothetical protein
VECENSSLPVKQFVAAPHVLIRTAHTNDECKQAQKQSSLGSQHHWMVGICIFFLYARKYCPGRLWAEMSRSKKL